MSSPSSKSYGKTNEGELVDLYGLTNRTGMEVGASIQALFIDFQSDNSA
jgi:hypothetical protein